MSDTPNGRFKDWVRLPDGRMAFVVARDDTATFAQPQRPYTTDPVDFATGKPFVRLPPDYPLMRRQP